ncbi:hypothetical protein J8G26_08810 [Acidovorax sp. JG5]|uniref:hypothetical protein n=1 Tax=Acidovorax sp. JG5 TaxID=2822718 RepID=UPI001B328931|nr:hypothetical protein [Acidovorax sp. JG5]MBP3980826.1 hypothetical protein [Acidovorax sp. JG5]
MTRETLYRKRGKRYEPVHEALGDWGGFMVTCAVRYCLGRSSYAPGVAMDWCRDNWDRLTEKDQHNIVRDVVDWLADRHIWDVDAAHMEDYRAEWARFALDRIAANGDDFGRIAVRAALYCAEKREAPEVQPFLKWIET